MVSGWLLRNCPERWTGTHQATHPIVWYVQVSTSVFLGLVILYIIFCLLLPLMLKMCNTVRWKINNIITSDSYYTYSSSSIVFHRTSETKSSVGSKVAENKAEPEEVVKKSLT